MAFSTPRLTDFLTIQRAEQILLENDNWPVKREYDEKFHILNSPSLFWGDVKHFRAACELRGKQISIAFLDIDSFKGFNDTHGEMTVDRDLLPKFMSELEAHVFSHGTLIGRVAMSILFFCLTLQVPRPEISWGGFKRG